MRRFFVEKIEDQNGIYLIKGPEARHILKVLRMGPGDRLILMDGQGDHFRVRIETVKRQELSVNIEGKLLPPAPSPISIIIGQAALKPKAMDMLIQKCSELGVEHVIPFVSQRTVFNSSGEHLENRGRHWLEISRNAAKQSGRPRPAEIGRPLEFNRLLEEYRGKDTLKIILWEGEKAQDLKDLLRKTLPMKDVLGLIGPEGGFADKEIVSAKASGFIPVSLGHRILRAETAGIALTAIIQYEWGDLGSNITKLGHN